jgi:hypothetical protein
MPLSITTHRHLSTVSTFLGFGAGAYLTFLLPRTHTFYDMLLFFLVPIMGAIIPGVSLGLCVPAACPHCHGRAYYAWSKPITYRCKDCGHLHNTGVYYSSDS